jgi:hypothetical protein
MQFNFVVSSNAAAVGLWQSCVVAVASELELAWRPPTAFGNRNGVYRYLFPYRRNGRRGLRGYSVWTRGSSRNLIATWPPARRDW